MIRIPLSEVKQKIAQGTGLTEAQIDEKIDTKLAQLSGLISREGAAHIVSNELGVKLFENSGKIKDVYPGMRNITFNAKVITVYEPREFRRSDGSAGKVASALVGDETGTTRLVGWGLQADTIGTLQKDMVINVTNGYARENNRGYSEIHLNDNAKVLINPEGIAITAKSSTPESYTRKKISELNEADNAVEIVGFIVQVFDLRFFEVCPECGGRVKQEDGAWNCPKHHAVQPDYSYVLNIFVEDESEERVRIVLFRNLIEQLLGKTKADMLAMKDDIQKFEDVKNALLGEQFKMQGRIKKNAFFDRIEFVPNSIMKADPVEELSRL